MTTWVFGYGSLVFRPGFAFVDRQPTVLPCHRRVFYQGSPDHRGTPEAPGRVATLLPDAAHQVGGVSYRVEDAVFAEVVAQLDVREAGGYERAVMQVHRPAGPPLSAWVFYATVHNEHYLGAASPEDIAAHVARSRGPSGPNDEYVLKLAEALRELSYDDEHVFAIERALMGGGRLVPDS